MICYRLAWLNGSSFPIGDAEKQRRRESLDINTLTGIIIDAALRIHRELGPGLLESVYEVLLAHDLTQCGIIVERQKRISFVHRGILFEEAFRVDLVVGNAVIVEVKAQEKLAPVHERQLQTYLKITDFRVGLILNFGAFYMKDGIKRIVNRI